MASGVEDSRPTGAALGAATAARAVTDLGPLAAAAPAEQLRVEGETLTAFKNRVDDLLTRLDRSKAAPHMLADGALPAGRLGSFDEADALRGAYTRVHARLEHLSRTLALQIEALAVTVDASRRNYHELDDDIRDRLHRIRVESDRLAAEAARLDARGGAAGVGGGADGHGQGHGGRGGAGQDGRGSGGHGSGSGAQAGGL